MKPQRLAPRRDDAPPLDHAEPTIGIGAGAETDGQVLVMHDLLGLNLDFKPKFVRRYLDGNAQWLDAFNRYARDVRDGSFPASEERYAG